MNRSGSLSTTALGCRESDTAALSPFVACPAVNNRLLSEEQEADIFLLCLPVLCGLRIPGHVKRIKDETPFPQSTTMLSAGLPRCSCSCFSPMHTLWTMSQ
jgi:hypothetical protein